MLDADWAKSMKKLKKELDECGKKLNEMDTRAKNIGKKLSAKVEDNGKKFIDLEKRVEAMDEKMDSILNILTNMSQRE